MAVIERYGYANFESKPELHEDLNYWDWSGMPMLFGVAVLVFEGNGVVINVQESMKYPEHFTKILLGVLFVWVCLITGFSALCYYVSFAMPHIFRATGKIWRI